MVKVIKKNPILVIFATYIVIEICKVTGMVCGPAMQRHFGFTNTQLGFILSSLSIGALLMCVSIGHLTDHFGLWRVWKTGISGCIAAIVLFFFAQGFWTVFAPIFLLGLMHVLTLNANNTYLSGEFSDNSLQIMGLASGLWFGSSVLSTPLIGLWVNYAGKAELGRLMFLVPYGIDILLLSAVLFFGAGLAKPLIKKTEHQDRENAAGNVETRNREKRNIFGWVAIVIMAYCHGCIIVGIVTWANPMVQHRFGVDDFQGSLTFAFFALGLALGRFTVASGVIKSSTRTMMSFSGIIGGCILAVALFLPIYPLTLAMLSLGGLALSTTAPCLLTIVSEHFPATRAHIYGHIGASIGISTFLTPSMIGFLSDYGLQINTAMLVSPFAALVLGVTALVWKMREKRQAELGIS